MRALTMLVISRRKGQTIAIGDDIEIVITEVHRSSVKVGIRAPRGYTVLRGEVSDAISAANREASGLSMERAHELTGNVPRRANAPGKSVPPRQGPDAAASQSRDAASDGPSEPKPSKPPPSAVAVTPSGPKPGGP